MFRSVHVRFILANVLVVILSLALTAFLASRMTNTEYDRLVAAGDRQYTWRLARLAADSYAQTNSWANIQQSVERMGQVSGDRVVVTDSEGKIVGDSSHDMIGKTIAPNRLPPSGKVQVDGVAVGYLLVNPTRTPPPPGGGFPATLNRLILSSALIAAAVAIVATLLLTRRMLQPVAALTAAARRMEKGDLDVRVTAESKDEIGALARAFNAMASSLARNEQLRRNMVSDVAHELRTPLTNLRGYLEAARDGVIQPDKQYIENLYEEAMILNRLTDDLQELALAEARQLRLTPQPVELGNLIEACLDAARLTADERGIHLRREIAAGLPIIEADPGRITQALRNLLNNAMDFTPRGGEVLVSVQAKDGEVHVKVQDSGPGIAADHLPFIFERFYRVDPSRTRSTGGAGLGLTIVKNLVEAHGGRVWVESTVGVGSTFSFSLPVCKVPLPTVTSL